LFADVRFTRSGDQLTVNVAKNPTVNRVAFEGNKKLKDEQLVAGAADAHVGKELSGIKRLDGIIELGICELGGFGWLAAPGMEIRSNRLGLDPLIALDPDGGRCPRHGFPPRREFCPRRGKKTFRHDSAGEQTCRDQAAGCRQMGAKT
jgi:hypothetical protein